MSDGEGLGIGGLIPLVGADAAIEDAPARTDRRLAVSKRVPGDTDARGNMIQPVVGDTSGHTGVSRKQHSQGGRGNLGRLHARDERRSEVRRFDRRQLHVIPHSQVQRESWNNPIVVLHETGKIPAAQEPMIGSVLLHRAHLASDEVG